MMPATATSNAPAKMMAKATTSSLRSEGSEDILDPVPRYTDGLPGRAGVDGGGRYGRGDGWTRQGAELRARGSALSSSVHRGLRDRTREAAGRPHRQHT